MAKFDLKNIKASSVQIKKDIDNTEKNRPVNKPVKEEKISEPTVKTEEITEEKRVDSSLNQIEKTGASETVSPMVEKKAEKITVGSTKTVSVTLPREIKNYLRYQPRLMGTSIAGFLAELIEEEQRSFDKKGIDLTKAPDFSKIPEAKTRQKGVNPVIVPVKMKVDQWQWLRRASIYSGQNVSQMVEGIIRKKIEADGVKI